MFNAIIIALIVGIALLVVLFIMFIRSQASNDAAARINVSPSFALLITDCKSEPRLTIKVRAEGLTLITRNSAQLTMIDLSSMSEYWSTV